MNVDTLNIGHYRVTSVSGRHFSVFNRKTDKVFDIPEEYYRSIKEDQSIAMCELVERTMRIT